MSENSVSNVAQHIEKKNNSNELVSQPKPLQNEQTITENVQKQSKEIAEEENKKQEKIAKNEKTQPTNNNNNNSDEKTRRKQIEIELKKWEREQVLIFKLFISLKKLL